MSDTEEIFDELISDAQEAISNVRTEMENKGVEDFELVSDIQNMISLLGRDIKSFLYLNEEDDEEE